MLFLHWFTIPSVCNLISPFKCISFGLEKCADYTIKPFLSIAEWVRFIPSKCELPIFNIVQIP